MSDGGSWVEIVLLAMLAAFIGLRLVSVLGKRTGHERPVGDAFRAGTPEVTTPVSRSAELRSRGQVAVPAGTDTALRRPFRPLPMPMPASIRSVSSVARAPPTR